MEFILITSFPSLFKNQSNLNDPFNRCCTEYVHDGAHSILMSRFMTVVAVILSTPHLCCITLCIVLLL